MKTILAVDDSATMREMVAFVLESAGYRVIEAEDEAQEHLESIEEMAMALGSGRHDPEVLNSIFRAAHSIKGGSGTFGFTQLADATHEMETLFDGLRKGSGQADESTVRLLLDACDVFKAHLAR